ncbi:hypothetical protein [Oscillibacter sp.]|uniref:hypothetical protein n=1 Tax=Oscillibacter sp. TaxID=1945593 RepID=UPI001B74994C|nr:hypothetical protein [Oscillibacter sp.]MBP3510055.1 hypothetical protein [Oscillibacter sp.]
MTFFNYTSMNGHTGKTFSELQFECFLTLKKHLMDYLLCAESSYSPEPADYWKKIAQMMPNVLSSCDTIDYRDPIMTDSYAICHLLDRYHRFQLMQEFLLNQNLTMRKVHKPTDILDVGTGPAPALFAFSDFYNILNEIAGEKKYACRQDYVEQSSAFRQFLHRFCELPDCAYAVPFHLGSFRDFSDIQFDEKYYEPGKGHRTRKYRYDMIIFSNFLTSQEGVKKFKKELREVCRAVRNHGLILVVGASASQSQKYRDTYDACDSVILRPFRNRLFVGNWEKILRHKFVYNYADAYGSELREFYQLIQQKIEKFNAPEEIPPKTKDFLTGRIQNTPEKIAEDGWSGVPWDLSIYQKHSRPARNSNRSLR